MKMIHRGYVYEALDPEMQDKINKFMAGEYTPKSTDELLAMINANASSNKSEQSDEPEDYYDAEEEIEKNLESDVQSILSKWKINFKEVDGDFIFEDDRRGYYIVRGREVVEVNKLIDSPEQYSAFPEYSGLADRINAEFWKYPETLYHATECDNIESILKDGLFTSKGTGLTNRNSRGVFTSTEPDGYIDYYGDCKVVIDAPSMKKSGYTPFMEKEPEVFEYMISQVISHKYDINATREISDSGGMDQNTWIVGGEIPPKYLSQLEA